MFRTGVQDLGEATFASVQCVGNGAGIGVGVMVNNHGVIGPRRASKVQMESFECGNPPSGSAWGRFSVRFYLTALLFLVFDVEVIFLYPWAVELRKLGMFGFVEALIFIS